MAGTRWRFVHASDFHLERPLLGLGDVPDHLRDPLIDAPFRAAQKVFDAVLEQEADFLVLSGDLADPHLAGPRGIVFLHEQFERLAAKNKRVYWAAGEVDSPVDWPTEFAWPANVRLFSGARPEEFVESRDGVPLAFITGQSFAERRVLRAADFWPEKHALFSIALAYGDADLEALSKRGIHYWALGGAHERDTPLATPTIIHSPGTPQGRTPQECGPHGCTLVAIEPDLAPKLTFISTDEFRWLDERVRVDETTTRDDLDRLLDKRMQELAVANPNVGLLVSWTVSGSGRLASGLRRGQLATELLARLRTDYGQRPRPLWSVAVDFEPAAVLPGEWYEQDTILGEFLRSVRRYQRGGAGIDELQLDDLLSERQLAGSLADALRLTDERSRERVLRRAAALGADLLAGEGA